METREGTTMKPQPRSKPSLSTTSDHPKRGRSSKITSELQVAIWEMIKKGTYPEVAARMSGVSHSTYHRWMKQGKNAIENGYESEFRAFREGVETARAIAEAEASRKLFEIAVEGNGGRGNAAALIEFLRRTAPERWAVKENAKTGTDEDQGPVQVKVHFVTGEKGRS